MRQIEKILREIAQEENLDFQPIANGWVLKIGAHFTTGYHFSINNGAASRLCDDKSATYEYLNHTGVPAVPHYFYMPAPGTENSLSLHKTDQIRELLKQYGELVLKPNQGSGGRRVIRVTNMDDLLYNAYKILKNPTYLTISPFFEMTHEYRVIILNQEVQLAYSKIIQDGGWKYNLGLGAKAEIIKENPQLETLALQTTKVLDINFASVDIAEIDGEYKVLEVNSGVMMEHFSSQSEENYQIAKRIYKKAIE